MTRAITRQLDRLERALAIAPDASLSGMEWRSADSAMRSQRLFLELVASSNPTPAEFALRRAEIEARIPSAGYWAPCETPEDKRQVERLREHMRATSPILQAILADPALQEEMDARSRAQLDRYLDADDPLRAVGVRASARKRAPRPTAPPPAPHGRHR